MKSILSIGTILAIPFLGKNCHSHIYGARLKLRIKEQERAGCAECGFCSLVINVTFNIISVDKSYFTLYSRRMKTMTVKLLLPDSTYDLVAERAKAEGVDPAHYCSILLTERLAGEARKMPSKPPIELHASSVENSGGIPMARELPDTIEQVFAVCRQVWHSKLEFSDAIHKVAKSLGVQETTVRDKCTRRISLPHVQVDTDRFLHMLNQPITLRDYLCHRFPKFSTEITQRFESIMPKNLNAN
jgi:hypothetical protein